MIPRVLNCYASDKAPRPFGQPHSLGGVLPESMRVSATIPIRDQGSTSRCVGYGVGVALMIAGGLDEVPSAKWLYDIGRGVSGSLGVDLGTTIGAVILAAQRLGFVRESALPSLQSNVESPPNWGDVQAARDQREIRSERLSCSVDERPLRVRQALAMGYGVVVGNAFDEATAQRYSGGVWQGVATREGGHCQGVIGYDPGCVIVMGSYGGSWGEHGMMRIADSVIADPQQTEDIWIVSFAPRYSR